MTACEITGRSGREQTKNSNGSLLGQSKEFFRLLIDLAEDADEAKRECH
jgi:hypothetical protein